MRAQPVPVIMLHSSGAFDLASSNAAHLSGSLVVIRRVPTAEAWSQHELNVGRLRRIFAASWRQYHRWRGLQRQRC